MAVDSVDSYSNIQSNYEKYKDLFSESTTNDMLNTDTFFSLLMAEMSNQDPLEPTSNTEFVSQMAQFTALQAQQDNLYYTNANFASSLVGKTVTVAENSGSELKTDTGTVTGLELTDKKFTVTVNGKQYSLSSVMNIGTTENVQQETAVVDATALMGKYVTIQVNGETEDEVLYEKGVVESVEVQDGATFVVVNGYAYKVSDIVQVKETAEADDSDSSTGSDTTDKSMKKY